MNAPAPSPAVYRRRRLVALLVLLLVVGLLWWGIAALVGAVTGGGTPATTGAAPAPTATTEPEAPDTAAVPEPETPAPTPDPTPEPPPAPAQCTAAEVVVTAHTDRDFYPADAQPQFSLSLHNRSDRDCLINVGTNAQEFKVTSGEDVIWVSTHCQRDGADQEVLLEAGRTVEAPAFGWVRERSTPDTCEGERPAAVAGGAYYRLTVTLGGIQSEPAVFVLE